jgi:hypothetical protein
MAEERRDPEKRPSPEALLEKAKKEERRIAWLSVKGTRLILSRESYWFPKAQPA